MHGRAASWRRCGSSSSSRAERPSVGGAGAYRRSPIWRRYARGTGGVHSGAVHQHSRLRPAEAPMPMTTNTPSTSPGSLRMRRARRGVRAGAVAVAVLVAGLAAPLAACAASWGIVSSPNPAGSTLTQLTADTCVNAIDCWAVGGYSDATNHHNLAEHYDGTGWTIVVAPAPAAIRWPSTTTAPGGRSSPAPSRPAARATRWTR